VKSINLGSGDVKIENVESHDINKEFNCDHSFDLKVFPWPLEDSSYDEVFLFHTIEHIEKKIHKFIFAEIRRILKTEGAFIFSFPEFEIICKNWLSNYQGERKHWEHTVYGLQRTASDYHVCAMDCIEAKDMLLEVGFGDIQIAAEDAFPHNTVIRCRRGTPKMTLEHLVYNEVIAEK
jgi:predicted SAM-dependent methyltransferase